MKKFAIGLRTKIILLSSFLLILPWFAYQYVLEMDKFLLQGQQQTLLGTTSAIATALHERPQLFNQSASFLPQVESGKDLYVYDIENAIKLDGNLNDWQEIKHKSLFYGKQYVRYQDDSSIDNPISFTNMVGKRQGYLYGYLQVNDTQPIFRQKNEQQIDKSDHFIIALTSPQGQLQHYVISVHNNGWFNAYLKANGVTELSQLKREKRIQGYWQQTTTGYNIEFRFPLDMLGDKLAFSLNTVSNSSRRHINHIISTSNIHDVEQLGTVLIPSPEIEQIIKSMSHVKSRIWIVDRHQRVIAKSGNIFDADGAWPAELSEPDNNAWLAMIKRNILSPLYSLFLSPPANDFNDDLKDATQLSSDFIMQAFTGESHTDSTLSNDGKAMIISAASPIRLNDKVMGMVIAQETTNGIKALRNQTLEKLFNTLLIIIFIATVAQFIFASNIAARIRKLRDQTDQAIDSQGRILNDLSASKSSDEIGDLSRGLFDMVHRLKQYHLYLENLSARLSHELRTPVAVVRSSLENLSLLPQNKENKKYIERAEKGINRLNRILTSMSEATRIEQSLQNSEPVTFPINELLDGCAQGYQMTYPDYQFILTLTEKPLSIFADPDFIVQLLDKLINNAMEFSAINDRITIELTRQSTHALITITNTGVLLPEKMNDELLKSMVSVRTQDKQKQTHLGLGLFIAQMITEFNQGHIQIQNRADRLGVEVLLSFPINQRN